MGLGSRQMVSAMTRFAFVFPGQGSQSVGMMKGFDTLPVVKQTFDEASELLQQNMWKMVTEGSEDELAQTVNTQPLMLVAGVATFRAWKAVGGADPAVVAGHSLGEYSALVAAGVIPFAQAVPLVRERAQQMQQAVPEGTGGIAAILGMDDEGIVSVCRDAAEGEVLEAANFNSPGQVVIAGHRTAVLRGIDLAKSRGARRAVMLAMSAPSHCSLMAPAADRLAELLRAATLSPPTIPLLHNADVQSYSDVDGIRAALIAQLCNPVRWVEIVRAFHDRGVTQVFECGPGKVLAGLNRRIVPEMEAAALVDAAALDQALQTVRG